MKRKSKKNEVLPLPSGDKYFICRTGGTWIGFRYKKIGMEDKRISVNICEASSRETVKLYYQDAKRVDEEALEGKNPYISAEDAEKYTAYPWSTKIE